MVDLLLTRVCDDDVSLRGQSLIGQINTVLCRFGRLDPTVKNRHFQAYCTSHYGSELWNLDCEKSRSTARLGGRV